MNVHQFLTSYSYGDAIGNEALALRDYLREQGLQSEIFSLFYHPRYAGQVRNYLDYDRFSSAANVVVFHFSIASPVTKKFLRLSDKKVIIYHNITPYYFFLDYHRILAKDCFKGRIELRQMADKVDLALGDSEYNRRELEEAGFSHTGVLPLAIDFSTFSGEGAPLIRELYADEKTNILYVGRIIPNKKIEDLIKAFHIYQRHFNAKSRLFLVGETRGFERYFSALNDLVSELGTHDVHFTGHIPQAEVIAYFKLAHLYLHLSEHEGFCAPIPESFHLGIPVLAFAAGAVAETMNGGGLLIQRKDFLSIAALMDRILRDALLRESLRQNQRRALSGAGKEESGRILLSYLQRL